MHSPRVSEYGGRKAYILLDYQTNLAKLKELLVARGKSPM